MEHQEAYEKARKRVEERMIKKEMETMHKKEVGNK